ncbi:MAG: thioredoxin family protein [Asgard group archaeon]|nr:thioredoxin family protein [Asgard group archaeon]
MKLKIFTKLDCPNCPAAKKIGKQLEEKGAKIEWLDLDEEEGLSEAVYYDVLSTPAFIVIDENDNEVNAWRGDLPTIELLQKELKIKK